jgi:hypothetical protein
VSAWATGRARTAFAVLLAVLVVVAAWASRVSEGDRAIAECDAAFARGDRVEAVALARLAAEARCPRCSAPELGFGRLAAIAANSEAKGDDVTAVAAWRAVRAAALGSALLDSSPAWRERADGEIARLEHRIDAAEVARGGTASPAASEERLRSALAAATVPSGMVFLVLAIGGALFVAGAIRFVRAQAFAASDLALAAIGIALAAAGALLF